MKLELLAYGHTKCNLDWAVSTLGESFHRLYYVQSGDCYCTISGQFHQFLPNHLYILPRHVPYIIAHNPQRPLDVVWQHIRLSDRVMGQHLVDIPAEDCPTLRHLLQSIKALSFGLEVLPPGEQNPENQWEISQILRVFLTVANKTAPLFLSLDSRITTVLQLVSDHPDGNFSVQELANHAQLERSHFSRIFKEQLSLTPKDFLRNARMDWSATQLLQGATIAKTAADAGYQDEKAFLRAFLSHFGTTPTQYRKYHKLQP